MIPIDEQIAKQRKHCNQYKEDYDILASLERLKKIDSVQVPDEPGTIDCSKSSHKVILHVEREDYDTLRDLLKQCKHNSSVTMDELGEMRDRAAAAAITRAAEGKS